MDNGAVHVHARNLREEIALKKQGIEKDRMSRTMESKGGRCTLKLIERRGGVGLGPLGPSPNE